MRKTNFLFKVIMYLMVPLCVMVSCAESSPEEKHLSSIDSKRIAIITDEIVPYAPFLNNAINALSSMQSAYGFEARHVVAKNTMEWTEQTYELAAQEYDLIIGLGLQAARAFDLVHATHPNIKFAVIDTAANNEHIKSVLFNMSESAYILGVMIATAFPHEKKFGYLGNYQDKVNFQFFYGFEQGILSIIPDAKILSEYTNSYNNAEITYKKALEMYKQVNFIAGMVSPQGNQGLFKAVKELHNKGREVYTSGIDTDQTTDKNPNIIGGVTKDTGLATTLIIQEFLDDQFAPDTLIIDFKTGASGILYITDEHVHYCNQDIITAKVLLAGKKVAQNFIEEKFLLQVPTNFSTYSGL